MLLRWWRPDDAEALIEIYRQNSDMKRQMSALDSLADAEKFIQHHYLPAENHAVFCLEDGGKPAGCVAVEFTAHNDDGAWDRGWVSYWNAPLVRGRGLMKIAVRAVCDWALGEYSADSDSTLVDTELLGELNSPKLRRLELGYRTNNPASGKVAAAAGFTMEGIEREKFLYDGQTFDAVNAARLRGDILRVNNQTNALGSVPVASSVMVHHVELWTADFGSVLAEWSPLMNALGARVGAEWEKGISWKGADGSYLVLEESPDVRGGLCRTNPGMNHLALNVGSRKKLDEIRQNALGWGWQELFAEKYPHAGGDEHTALYLENSEGFEVELVVEN